MYKCICEAEFEEPLVLVERNRVDGHTEVLKIVVCPYCGSAHFEEVDDEEE